MAKAPLPPKGFPLPKGTKGMPPVKPGKGMPMPKEMGKALGKPAISITIALPKKAVGKTKK